VSYIVAVAAPIGGGKTTLVQAMASALADAATLHFDSYEKATGRPARELLDWIREGADFDRFVEPELVVALEALRRGEAVVDPRSGVTIPPRKYIVFEMPLGREAAQVAPLIDLVLWVDIPPDVALARKVREFVETFLQRDERTHRESLGWLAQFLDNYLLVVGDLLAIQRERVRAGADIILDGAEPFNRLVEAAVSEIRRRHP
jgi:uridine kinase